MLLLKSTLSALLVGVCAVAFSQGPSLPKTPAGKVLEDWIAAFNSGDRAKIVAFHKGLGWAPNPERVADMDYSLAKRSRGLVLLKVREKSDREAEAVVRTSLTEEYLTLSVATPEGAKPQLGLDFSGRPSDVPRAKVAEADIPKELDAFIERLHNADMFWGTVLIAKNGKPVFSKAKGLASIAWNQPIKLDTKFNLASMGKMFTAVAIAQLVDQGKLTYETKIGDVLSDYPNKDVREKVTVHHLLTHTSGLGDIFNQEYIEGAKDRFRDLKDYMALYNDRGLEFEPGARSRYSNYGFIVLGAIVEKLSGMPYWDYVQKNVFDPAGMKNTGAYDMDFDWPNLATGYTRQQFNGPMLTDKRKNNLFMHSIKGTPAGGSFSTAEDMILFAEALRSGKILGRKQFEVLTSAKAPSQDYGYGFGVRSIGGDTVVGHNGGFPGISSDLSIFLKSAYTVIVLSNVDQGAGPVSNKALTLLGDALQP